ncbi:MAG: translation elongation factor-like protein [Thermodesulfobacteriota bacterium]
MPEERVGKVMHFFAKPMVAAIDVVAGTISVGDRLHFVGHTTDFETQVASMQQEHETITSAGPGQQIGIKVTERAREGDEVYKVI